MRKIVFNNNHIVITKIAPPATDFINLRANCGWGYICLEQAEMALRNSLFISSARINGRTIGFGRIIGDQALNYYIQDIAVANDCRNLGVGGAIIANLLDQLRLSGAAGCTIGLMAAAGKEDFYRQFGFVERPSAAFGAGMTLNI
jgi:ribosomal protein S18 acetylase RimI-like enzyme